MRRRTSVRLDRDLVRRRYVILALFGSMAVASIMLTRVGAATTEGVPGLYSLSALWVVGGCVLTTLYVQRIKRLIGRILWAVGGQISKKAKE